MRFVELVIQGIRRFTGTQRVVFPEKSVWLASGTATGKSTVAQLMRACLDPAYAIEIESTLVPWRPEQDISRYGLLFCNDRGRARILRDARSGAIQVARLDSTGKKYTTVATDPAGALNLLADEFDFPNPADWAAVYLWSADAAASSAASSAAATVGGGEADVSALGAQIEELMAERALMQNVDKIQFELDGLQDQQFKAEEELRRLDQKRLQVQAIDAELARTAPLAEVDRKFVDQARRFKEIERSRHDRTLQLEEQVEKARAALAVAEGRRLWLKDPVFVAACVGTLLGFVVPIVLKVYPLTLLGFGGLVGGLPFLAWRTKKHVDSIGQLRRQLKNAEDRLSAFQREQDEFFGRIASLTKALQALDVSDMIKLWDERQGLIQKRDDALKAIESENVDAKRRELEAEIAARAATIAKLHGQLESVASAQRDLGEINRQIADLERRIKVAKAGGAVPAAVTSGPAQTPRERLAALVLAGARVARKDPAQFAPALSGFVTKLVQAVFPDRFREVTIDASGSVVWVDAVRMEPLESRAVHRALELVTLAAAAVGAAKIAARERTFPLVWDEPFGDLDDATLGRLAQMVVKAAPELQLIVLTGRKALGGALGEPKPLV